MTTSVPPRVLRVIVASALALLLAPVGLAGDSSARGPVTNLPLPRYVSMRAETANARRGPGLDHRVDWEFLRRGMPLEVTAEHGHWRLVRDAEGLGGWVHHSLLSGVRTGVVRGEGLAPLRAAASGEAAVRAYLEPGVVARIKRCEGPVCLVDAAGTDGWIARAALWGAGAGDDVD